MRKYKRMNTLGCNRPIKKEEEEKPNPKTLQLLKLVQLIEPKLVSYYLEQVSVFLKNDKKDLWFPLISPNLDAFLVRIIQDTRVLKTVLEALDDKGKVTANDIMETMETNRNVYNVVHSYVSSGVNRNTLVYRKVAEAKYLRPPDISPTERSCPVGCRAPFESAPTARKPSEGVRRAVITLPFKFHWINATTRFIRDTTEDQFEYPEMSIEQAEFVYSLIRQKKADNDSDPSIQASYGPLKEALREFNVDNEFKATFTYLCGDLVRLALEKLPLNNNKSEGKQKSEGKDNVSNSLDLDNLTKAQKNLARKTTMIKLLEPNFIRTALQMILDFIHEDTEASIVFRNANEEQCQFLQSALAMAKSRKLHGVFDEDSRNLLRKIGKHLSTCQFFDLKIDLAKLEKDTMLRTVSLIKTPKDEYRAPSSVPRSSTSTVGSNDNTQATECDRVAPMYQNAHDNERDSTNIPTTKMEKAETKEAIRTVEKKQVSDKTETDSTSHTSDKSEVKPIKISAEEQKTKVEKPTIINEKKPIVDNSKVTDTVESKATDKKVKEQAKTIPQEKKSVIDKPVETVESKAIDKKAKEQAKTIPQEKKSIIDKPVETVDAKNTGKNNTEQLKPTNKPIDKQAQAKRDQSVGRGLGLRKSRLIEGLSTPLESDVAIRMMRQMGWEGGPLGARGDGLAEPVMPAFHLKSGAGLGHVAPKKEPKVQKSTQTQPLKPAHPQPQKSANPQPQKPQPQSQKSAQPQPQKPQTQPPKSAQTQPPKSAQPQPQKSQPQIQPKPLPKTVHCHKPSNIRLDLLRQIYLLLTEEPLERMVVYSSKLAKKDIKFLEGTIKVVLRKGALLFSDNVMQDVYGKIIAVMTCKPDLQLGCVFGPDKRSVVIYKNNDSVPINLETIQNELPVEDVIPLASKYLKVDLITPDMTTELGMRLTSSQSIKCAKMLGHKVILLTTILDLINGDHTEHVMKFDYPMTCTQAIYIKEMVSGINSRTKWTHCTRFENYLVTETLTAAVKMDVFVVVLFGNNNLHVTFQKIKQSPPANSVVERKPDSIDLTNNNNNKVVSKETTKPNKDEVNDSIAKDYNKNAKNDIKTVSDNDVIIISDSDTTDSESIKKDSKNSDKSNVKDDSTSNSSFDSDINDGDKTILDDAVEENKYKKNNDDTITKVNNDVLTNPCETNKKINKGINNMKYIGVAPDSYPMENVGIDEVITFQNNIAEKLDSNKEKPLLECFGMKNGAMIYCCHNEYGRFLIESVANDMGLNTINITKLYKNRTPYKMKARLNSYVEINLKNLFSKVEDYNVGLKTDLWVVTDVQSGSGHITISMEIDGNSFDYISENNFSIFVGVDKLRFTILWD